MRRIGVYTTARVRTGRLERLERHAGRLRRDAERLGLPLPERRAIEAAALDVVRATLGREDGVLRIAWSRAEPASGAADAGGGPVSAFSLDATTRPLGPEPRTWRAATARTLHPGPGARRNAKALDVPAWEAARAERSASGVDEVLLFDGAGRLVEGSITNLIVVTRDGRLETPARSLGGVEGLGLEIVRDFLGPGALRESDALDRATLASARELIATNAVRGVAAIVALDGTPIGEARAGPMTTRLRSLFFRD